MDGTLVQTYDASLNGASRAVCTGIRHGKAVHPSGRYIAIRFLGATSELILGIGTVVSFTHPIKSLNYASGSSVNTTTQLLSQTVNTVTEVNNYNTTVIGGGNNMYYTFILNSLNDTSYAGNPLGYNISSIDYVGWLNTLDSSTYTRLRNITGTPTITSGLFNDIKNSSGVVSPIVLPQTATKVGVSLNLPIGLS